MAKGTDLTKAEFVVRSAESPSLTGKLYFSMTQWRQNREEGRPRIYAMLQSGQIVEYTELVTAEQELENPIPVCAAFEDAQYIDLGVFHHFGDTN